MSTTPSYMLEEIGALYAFLETGFEVDYGFFLINRGNLGDKAAWFAARGDLLRGFGASGDPRDPVSHTLNFMFAGSDIVRKFLEEDETNMAEFLYDFQTYCRQGLLKEHRHKGKINPGTIRDYGGKKKKPDDIRKENSVLLRLLWKQSMNETCSKVPWDDWAYECIRKHKKMFGWPDDVTWPSGPKAYSTIPRGDSACNLRAALLAAPERKVRMVDWDKEEKQLDEDLLHCAHGTDPSWLDIPLIVSQSGLVLLRIGDIDSQACEHASIPATSSRSSAKRGHTAKAAKQDSASDGEGSALSMSDDSGVHRSKTKQQARKRHTNKDDTVGFQHARSTSKPRKADTKKRTSKRDRGHDNEQDHVHEEDNVVRVAKRPKSCVLIENSNDEMEAENKQDPPPSNIGHQKEMIGDIGVLAGGGVHIPPVHSIDDTTLQESYQTEQSSVSEGDPWPTPPGGDGTAIVYSYDMPSHPDAPTFQGASAMQGRPISMSQQPPSGTGTAAQQVPRPPSRTRAPAHSGQLAATRAVVTWPQSPTAYHSAQRSSEAPNDVGDLPDDCLLRSIHLKGSCIVVNLLSGLMVINLQDVNAETTKSVRKYGGAELKAWDAMEKSSAVGRFRDVEIRGFLRQTTLSQYESAAHGAYPPQHGAPSTDQYHGNTTDFTSHSETMFNQYSVYDGSYYQVDDMYTTQYNNQGNAREVGKIVYGEGTDATYGYRGQGAYSEAPHES
ncbi:hypothetical protein M422DRAFT_251137 [Sphaerobolus stellatus SS14]|uniref:Uncharacterized protein n=1 Tax=Sphaerobolus stellatus (strain SS14) TaxID=990650 RepID=A0A0C9VEA7_SPHS4|nr:hypothetical protein M422DRAFT_251137 [Sphaerobolus stellatus SS14]